MGVLSFFIHSFSPSSLSFIFFISSRDERGEVLMFRAGFEAEDEMPAKAGET